jgi:chorismate mutase
MDGLMIESHIHPESAKSDREQQVTPKQLAALLSGLILRTPGDSRHHFLKHLRNEIDMIDDQLLETLARRMHIIEEIGKFKKEQSITILQAQRSRHVFSDRIEKGNRLKLHVPFLKEMLKSIHNEAIRIQVEIMKQDEIVLKNEDQH